MILSIDPGARSGWAVSDPRLSGSIDHERAAAEDWWADRAPRGMMTAWANFSKEERLKRVLGTYARWLEGLAKYFKPEIIVLERQKPFRGRAGTNVVEFRGASLAVIGKLDLAFVEVGPDQWRKLLAGRPYDPAKDHELAAEVMLEWWAAIRSGRLEAAE